ncbi:MAG TPA: hypothetical protein VMW83_12330 [Spirochaetia bacterium]|nr:hypothetical protein [Spirochaetia bacterium]
MAGPLFSPAADSFLAVGSTARKTGDWERLRLQLLQVLEGKEEWQYLLQIALAEGDVDLFSRHSSALRLDCRKDLAQEKDFPTAAVYREMAQGYISLGLPGGLPGTG